MAGGQTVWHPVRAQGTGRRTGPDACGDSVRAIRRRCHARCTSHGTHQRVHHAQRGRECVRGVVASRDTTSAAPGGGTAGRPQHTRRAAAGGWGGAVLVPAGARGPLAPVACWRLPAALGASASATQGAWEACRRQAVRQAGRASGSRGGACGRGPSPAGHTPVPCAGRAAPWALDAPSAWGGLCRPPMHIKLSTPRKLLWHYRVAPHTIMPASKELPYDDNTTGGPCSA